jgi:hypothetical protein
MCVAYCVDGDARLRHGVGGGKAKYCLNTPRQRSFEVHGRPCFAVVFIHRVVRDSCTILRRCSCATSQPHPRTNQNPSSPPPNTSQTVTVRNRVSTFRIPHTLLLPFPYFFLSFQTFHASSRDLCSKIDNLLSTKGTFHPY